MNDSKESPAPGDAKAPEPAADAQALRALLERGDVEEFNRRRPRYRLDLTGVDLSGKDLRNVNLSHSILDRAMFRGSDLTGANLDDASLERAELTGAILAQARFRHCN